MTEHAALAQWIVERLTVAEESQPTSAVRDETVRRLKVQTLGAAVLQALAAEPDNPGRRVQDTVEVTGKLSADPQFAAWADEHRRWSAGGADPPRTAARLLAGRNRGLGIRLGTLGVVVLVGLIAIVVLVTSNSSGTIVGRWEKISDLSRQRTRNPRQSLTGPSSQVSGRQPAHLRPPRHQVGTVSSPAPVHRSSHDPPRERPETTVRDR